MKSMTRLIIAFSFVFLAGCTKPNETRRLLEADGVEYIEIGGYSVFGCSEDDSFATKFSGVKNGKSVKGVACSGILKGTTLRYQ